MWNKSVTLYIDDNSVRLLVAKGKRVIKWSYMDLEPGLVKGSVVVQQAEVARRIKLFLKSHKIRTKSIFLGFSGLHTLTRPAELPEMPATMLAEAITREARRVLPAPPEQLYISWSYLPAPKSRVRVFIVGVPRTTADSLVKTVRAAGFEPKKMGIKPLILTKLVPVNTAIVIDIQPKEFDIIFMFDGVPQPIRTVPFPEEELSQQDRLDMILNDFNRTVKFHDANNPEKPLHANIPIFVSGEFTDNSELQKSLAEAVGHPVIPLNSTLKDSHQINMGRYMVNMALVAKNPGPMRKSTFQTSNINVLPVPYQPKPISLTRVIGIPGGATAVALVVPIMMLMQSTAANIEAIQAQLDTTNHVINQKTAQRQELNKAVTDLKKQSAAARLVYDGLAVSMNTLKTGQETINGNLSLVLSVLPPSVELKGVLESKDSLTVTGQSNNEAEVLRYARALDASGRFAEVTISSLAINLPDKGSVEKTGITSFTLTLDCKE
jgi:hypothetical protein